MRAASPHVRQKTIRFHSLREFFDRYGEADANHEYAVAWLDSIVGGARRGRGLLMLGDHVAEPPAKSIPPQDSTRKPALSVFLRPPFSIISPCSLRLFNSAYFRKPLGKPGNVVDYKSYFYPLDGIEGWNRLYGPQGLRQFQCVVPEKIAPQTIPEMLRVSQRAGHASFLTVLKKFGTVASPGILSFPRPGYTLTLDFPYRGKKPIVFSVTWTPLHSAPEVRSIHTRTHG